MVRLFETSRKYNERMKRRSNLLMSNAKLVKLINDYRNLHNKIKAGIHDLPVPNQRRLFTQSHNMRHAIVNRAQQRMSNHGANTRRNYFPIHNSVWVKVTKILAAVPNTRRLRPPRTPTKIVLVRQPNGNIGLGRKN
jgi:hypothetical protein